MNAFDLPDGWERHLRQTRRERRRREAAEARRRIFDWERDAEFGARRQPTTTERTR